MFALIMNALKSPRTPSISDINFEHVVLNTYIYGNMCCC